MDPASTTPPPTSVRARTPPTPLHGPRYDAYEPYSPRRSTRTSAHSNPYASIHDRSPGAHRATTPVVTGKKARFARANTQLSSPPTSPTSPTSPVKRRAPHARRTPQRGFQTRSQQKPGNGVLSDSDGPPVPSLAPAALDPAAMFPTPVKTPKKRKAAVSSTGRILSFQPSDPNDVMPLPRSFKKPAHSKNVGFDLYEDEPSEDEKDIEIYTDPSARVPEMDRSEDNPFVGPRKVDDRPVRKRAPKKSAEREEARMDEAVKNDEGITYVFRGKRIFRPFVDQTQAPSAASEISGSLEQRMRTRQAGSAAQRPLTRSSIKPRRLFISKEQLCVGEGDVDEEAVTDIDEEAVTDIDSDLPGTKPGPKKSTESGAKNTTASLSGHVKTLAPPTKTHATRSTTKKAPAAPRASTPTRAKESTALETSFPSTATPAVTPTTTDQSPFDIWQRTKNGKKRPADPTEHRVGGKKRTRRHAPRPS